ncbi:MAG TPA: cysteine hydrolase family protein [Spirochaetota bacterium]|nr:cysteine hydrolase family protein [Spirochaetota bacterium]
MKTALLVIDVQNDYFPGGRMELHGSVEAGEKIGDLMRIFRKRSLPVVHVQHVSVRPGAAFFLPGTSGVEFHDSVKPLAGEKIFVKNYPNSFRDTGLDAYLKENGVSRLVVAGMMTHLCVDTTVRAAFDLGYGCIVAGDCCATRALKINGAEVTAENVQNSFLAALNGIFAKVMTKDEAMQLNL